MSGPGRRFEPGELDGGPDDASTLALLETARDLEAFARSEGTGPSVGFEDRVMAAIANEAPPRVVVRGWSIGGLASAVADAWRIAVGSGRPVLVRTQALALVVLVALAVGSVGTLAAVGAARLLGTTPPEPSPIVATSPIVAPSPVVAPSPSPSSIAPSPSPSPTTTPGPTPTLTPSPTPSATDEPVVTATPDATETDEPEDTPEPDETCDSSGPGNPCGESSGSGSGED